MNTAALQEVATVSAEALASLWMEAKQEEKRAAERRISIEEKLIGLIGKRDEGSKTSKIGSFSITITGRRSYSVSDIYGLADMAPDLVKPTLNETALKKLREEHPESYQFIAAKFITVKDGKPGVDVKVTA